MHARAPCMQGVKMCTTDFWAAYVYIYILYFKNKKTLHLVWRKTKPNEEWTKIFEFHEIWKINENVLRVMIMITRNYFVFTSLHDLHRFCKCTTNTVNAQLTFAFVPSKNLIFENLSSHCKFDSKTKLVWKLILGFDLYFQILTSS
jgi:flagellar biosynthesis protein FlhB